VNAEQFFHVCRSAAAIANVREVAVFGAAAIVPWIASDCPAAPFWQSVELDIDPGGKDLADLVDGSIGELSVFEETFGVRAHGVTLDAFVAPGDWQARARVFEDPVSKVHVRAPHPRDLAVAKLLRGDHRDWAFAAFCRDHFGVTPESLAQGLRATAVARPEYARAAEQAAALLPARLGPA
jgi:hypothetical protein